MTEVYRETFTTKELKHGHVQVGTEAVSVSNSLSFRADKGVLIKSDTNNTAPIYVGARNVSTALGGNTGMPLQPGESVIIPANDPAELFVIADDVDQVVYWMCG